MGIGFGVGAKLYDSRERTSLLQSARGGGGEAGGLGTLCVCAGSICPTSSYAKQRNARPVSITHSACIPIPNPIVAAPVPAPTDRPLPPPALILQLFSRTVYVRFMYPRYR